MTKRIRPIRVLVAKTSLDGHLRGVVTVVRAFRDAGMEVIYGGQITPAEICRIAIQEDVDVIGLNIGGHVGTVADLMSMLAHEGVDDVLVVGGGPILPENITKLKALGLAGVFPSGSRLADIVRFVQESAPQGKRTQKT